MSEPAPDGLRLSPEEVAELTERLFDWRKPSGSESGVPLESCLSIFEGEGIPEEAIRAAVDEVVRHREQRLSSLLGRKAAELERMLLGLLVRLDEAFRIEIEAPRGKNLRPGSDGSEAVVLQVTAGHGELEVRAFELSKRGTRRLFAILVQGERFAGPLERLLGRRGRQPPRVVVLEPGGMNLRALLAASLTRGDGVANVGRSVALALECLHDAVLQEVDGALAFVRHLRFDPEEPRQGEAT
jgi:hypothetical protein